MTFKLIKSLNWFCKDGIEFFDEHMLNALVSNICKAFIFCIYIAFLSPSSPFTLNLSILSSLFNWLISDFLLYFRTVIDFDFLWYNYVVTTWTICLDATLKQLCGKW